MKWWMYEKEFFMLTCNRKQSYNNISHLEWNSCRRRLLCLSSRSAIGKRGSTCSSNVFRKCRVLVQNWHFGLWCRTYFCQTVSLLDLLCRIFSLLLKTGHLCCCYNNLMDFSKTYPWWFSVNHQYFVTLVILILFFLFA